MIRISTFSDQKILELCQKYGAQTRFWRQKFIGLLPEVNRRKLYEKKGFGSIFEFAKKIAGLSEEQVRTALNLERNFADKPVLQKLLINGDVSLNKLVRITSVVTKENEQFWADQIKLLPQKAIETLVRDEKDHQKKVQDGEQKPFFEERELRAQLPPLLVGQTEELQLSAEIKTELLELQRKGIDLNSLLQEFLDKRKEEIEEEKSTHVVAPTPSRYISVKVRRLLQKEHGTKCSIPNCAKPSEHIHHAQRFSLAHLHDPRYLAPLCKEHHLIAHSIDVNFQRERVERILPGQRFNSNL